MVDLEERVEKLEAVVFSKEEKFETFQDRMENLAKKVGTTIEEVTNVIEFGADRPYILPEIPGESLRDKQQKFVAIFLTVLKFCYGSDTMKASRLKKIAGDRGILDTHFGSNVKGYRPYIRSVGKIRSPDTAYKITHPAGTNRGIQLLRDLSAQPDEEATSSISMQGDEVDRESLGLASPSSLESSAASR